MFTAQPAKPAAKLWTPAIGAVTAANALQHGGRVIGLTMGQFSMLDLLGALLDKTGPADVRLSTWTVGIRDAHNAGWMLDHGKMRSFQLFVDKSFPTRQAAYCSAVVRIFGDRAINASDIHAKVATITNKRWSIAVRASMNLNNNPRCEQYDIDDDAQICGFFGAHFDLMAEHGRIGLPAIPNRDVDAIFERIKRGVNPFSVPTAQQLAGAGVPFGPAFKAWVAAQLMANLRNGDRPKDVAQLAKAVGASMQDVSSAMHAGEGPIAEDVAAIMLGAKCPKSGD